MALPERVIADFVSVLYPGSTSARPTRWLRNLTKVRRGPAFAHLGAKSPHIIASALQCAVRSALPHGLTGGFAFILLFCNCRLAISSSRPRTCARTRPSAPPAARRPRRPRPCRCGGFPLSEPGIALELPRRVVFALRCRLKCVFSFPASTPCAAAADVQQGLGGGRPPRRLRHGRRRGVPRRGHGRRHGRRVVSSLSVRCHRRSPTVATHECAQSF